MSSTFCPNCGTPRLGAFRFCRNCQFDFDSAPTSAAPAPSRAINEPAPTRVATPTPSTPVIRAPATRLPLGLSLGGAVGLGLLALVVWSVLTGGNKSSPSSQAPAAAPPVATPAANGNPAIASELAAGIDDVYCGSAPMAEWCQAISRIAGKPDVYVELPVAFVGFHALSDTVAESTCRDLVAIHYDANAVDLGITSVIIVGPGNQKMAECRKSD